MFVLKTFVTVLALGFTTVSAVPHGIRARCKHTGKHTSLAAIASPSAAAVSVSTSVAAEPTDSAVASSVVSSDASVSTSASVSVSTSAPAASHSASSSVAPSHSSSASAPAQTFASSALRALFPVSQEKSWSTSSSVQGARPLSDATLRPTKVMSVLSHNYVDHAGKKAMQAHYPAGSFNLKNEPHGGVSFYALGPSDIDFTTAKEVTLGYSVFFEDGFEWVKGGKLPGLYGGDNAETAVSCSGGRRDDTCWSSRLMWRTAGAGELYTYLPPDEAANKAVCDVPPMSTCNDVYGASVGRGAFDWKDGQWNTVSQRLRLNDAGKANGEIELFVEGKSVIKATGLVLRRTDAGRIFGIQMQSFFGGSDRSWATPKDQNIYFADFSVAITEKL
ncbi:hypothetical protein K474DRAFT_1703850 [Panus rudis PR-1116 ss-1]|nr:hypothetical protein K474DRAFT_1703850 [Panus rudis PR-1116 ss-1]